MIDAERHSEGLGIVVVGAFNPAIFHPTWFTSEGLLAPMTDSEITLHIAHAQFTAFDAGWLRLQVDGERLQASTADPSAFDTLRDLVLGIASLLRHTPVGALGINTSVHYRLESTDARNEVLARYAPLAPWQQVLEEPQLSTVSVGARRPDAHPGRLRLTLEPSTKAQPGVYAHLNDHFARTEQDRDQPHGAELAIEVLTKEWGAAQQRSRELIEEVVTRR